MFQWTALSVWLGSSQKYLSLTSLILPSQNCIKDSIKILVSSFSPIHCRSESPWLKWGYCEPAFLLYLDNLAEKLRETASAVRLSLLSAAWSCCMFLVCSQGLYNKWTDSGFQQTFTAPHFWAPQVPDQGLPRLFFFWDHSPWLVNGHLPGCKALSTFLCKCLCPKHFYSFCPFFWGWGGVEGGKGGSSAQNFFQALHSGIR